MRAGDEAHTAVEVSSAPGAQEHCTEDLGAPSVTTTPSPYEVWGRDCKVTEGEMWDSRVQQFRAPQGLTGTSILVFSCPSPRSQEDGVCQVLSSPRGAQRTLPPAMTSLNPGVAELGRPRRPEPQPCLHL